MTDRTGPHDVTGRKIGVYNLVQIEEVPEYLFKSYMLGTSLEAELGKRIELLRHAYSLVVPPDDSPDINWYSRDGNYVHLCCKSVEYSNVVKGNYIWTFCEYFPTNCVRIIPANIFIQSVFFPTTPDRDHDQTYCSYVESVLKKSLADLALDHDEAIKHFLQKRD
ncbi:MAG: hypothetical protein ABL898_18385 [Hyphomicrobiaceae bacterium]|nr:hypothetical protein [Hyphomicrobiaceae bacterium]